MLAGAALSLAFAAAAPVRAENPAPAPTPGIPLTLINHGTTPVRSAAIDIPFTDLDRLGVEPGTALEAATASGKVLPVQLAGENQAARVIVSLDAGEQLDLQLRPTKKWADGFASASFDAATGDAMLGNGVIEFRYGEGKWGLGFAGAADDTRPDGLSVLADCRMKFWLDSERRGRQMGISEENVGKMGLMPSGEARLLRGEAHALPDGSAVLELTHGFDGFAADVTWTERFTLPSGKPVLLYDTRFATSGAAGRFLAYVDHGAGIHGEFGKLLRGKTRFKFEKPKAPERVLLSGKENSFLRLGWRAERCWVGIDSELGFGVGISTSKNITRSLPGSSVWTISNNGFFVRVIDTEQEHLPYEFSKEKPLELGFAFVATSGGVSIWNQTRQLFASVTQGKLPPIATAVGVYLDNRPLQAAEVAGFHADGASLAGLPITGTVRRAAMEIDLARPMRLVVTTEAAATDNPVTIKAIPWNRPNEPVPLIVLDRAGDAEIDFTAVTGWGGKRQKFVLEIDQPSNSRLASLRLEPSGFPSPDLDTPADGMQLTDLATFFRWKQVKGALDYELQLAREESFASPTTLPVRSEVEWPYFMPADKKLPEPGKWFWRVRAVEEGNPGQWSVVRSFEVNNDHVAKPVKTKISPEHPLFTMESFRVKDFAKFKNNIPEDIKPYVAINCHTKFDPIGFLKPLHESGQMAFIRTHGPGPLAHWMPLGDVERVFQTYPNVIGITGGETLSAHYHGGEAQTYINRLLKLCGKYGRIFYDADGTYPGENKWEALYSKEGALLKEYAGHLIFAQKNNILHRQFVSQSSVLGLYLAGDLLAQGAWEDGGWYWEQVGFRRLGEIRGQRGGDTLMPRNFWNLNFLMGVARGCTVFSFEGQTGTTPVSPGWTFAKNGKPPQFNPTAYWTTEGELTETFHRFCLPFIRAIIKHKLVPTKEQVLDNVRLAVYNDGVPKKEDGDQYYFEWEGLYRGTYGFRDIGVYPGTLMEFFPNTGRYFFIPVFPQGKVDLGRGIQTLPLSELLDAGTVRNRFDSAYPEWYRGEALVTLVGDTLSVLNSRENEDVTEAFDVPLKDRGRFQSISGSIPPHSYLVGKFSDGNRRLWLQANAEYPDRPTEFAVKMTSKPKVSVVPEAAAVLNQWDEEKKNLSLRLAHADGAVEVEISD